MSKKKKRRKIVDIKEIKSNLKGTISCCMITRDEESFIPDAIRSVKELADEVVVVDTGSVDGTVEVAKKLGAKVFSFKWKNDFSSARNYAISKATKDWILILDADEVLDEDAIDKIKKLVTGIDEAGFLFDQWTYTNASTTFGWKPVSEKKEMARGALGYFCNQQVRLFPNRTYIRYEGEVHENVEKSLQVHGIPIFKTDIVVHHYGRIKESDRIFRKSLLYLELGRKKLQAEPSNVKFIYEVATQLLDLGRVDDAIKHAKEGLEVDPENWELLNILGLAYLRIGMKEEAQDCFKRALKKAPEMPDLYNNMGVALMEMEESGEALSYFKKGLEFSPENANLLRNAASASLHTGMLDEALGYIQSSLKIDPFMPSSHTIHADILFSMGEYEGAKTALSRIRFLPETPLKVYLKAIQLYSKMKLYDEAESVVKLAMDTYPGQFELQYLYGKILEMKGKDKEALTVYQKCLAERPNNGDIVNSIGCIMEKQNKLQEAVSYFSRALELQPFNSKIEANLGIVLSRLGKDDEAEAHFKNALMGAPDSAFIHNSFGCHLANLARYNEAVIHFTRAVELEPDNASYYRNLALACEKLGLYSKAVEIYKRMVILDPSLADFARERLNMMKEPV